MIGCWKRFQFHLLAVTLHWCWDICCNSRCLDIWWLSGNILQEHGCSPSPKNQSASFRPEPSPPLPDPHPRQALLSSRTNRCFSCDTVCCLTPRQGAVWHSHATVSFGRYFALCMQGNAADDNTISSSDLMVFRAGFSNVL